MIGIKTFLHRYLLLQVKRQRQPAYPLTRSWARRAAGIAKANA
jgi:hypothetical protein